MGEAAAKTSPKIEPATPGPRYTRGFAVLHWLVAGLLVAAYVITETRAAVTGLAQEVLQVAHIQLGLLLLVLMLVRVVWLPWSNAPGPVGQPGFLDRLTAATHSLLYVLMFLAPLSGVAMWLLQAQPLSVFGLMTLPSPLSDESRWLLPVAKRLHEISAHGLLIVSLIHVVAALYHHFARRDRLISRMSLW